MIALLGFVQALALIGAAILAVRFGYALARRGAR